ncbi:heavy metal-binding domain-containing protein [Caulobacter segnis]
MHPEVRQDHPGACPICGMALEPATVTADSGPSPELADMTRRFWLSLALSVPVLILEMGGHLVPVSPASHSADERLDLGATRFSPRPSSSGAGWPFFKRGWTSLKTRHLNMFTLIAMGTGGGVDLQRSGLARAGAFPARLPGRRRGGRWSISRRRRSSPSLCCSARFLSCGRGNAPRARSRRC